MLKYLRNNTKTIIWIFVIAFILWCVGSSMINRSQSSAYAAKIFGKTISASEFDFAYRTVYFSPRIQSLLREQRSLPDDTIVTAALQHIALRKEAKKRGIKVSDSELREEIYTRFGGDTGFNPNFYQRWVKNVTQLPVRKYEEGVRNELRVRKLLTSVQNKSSVTEEEIRDYYLKQHLSIAVSYVIFDSSDYKDAITYTNNDLVSYYQEHIGKYKTEKKVTLSYVLISPSNFIESIEVDEDILASYFEKNKSRFVEANESVNFEDVKERITKSYTQEQAYEQARLISEKLLEVSANPAELQQLIDTHGLAFTKEPSLPLTEVSKKIGYFGDINTLFSGKQIGSFYLTETALGFIFYKIMHVEQPNVIPFNECKEIVINDYLNDKALDVAFDKARDFHKKAKSENTLSVNPDLNVVNSALFKRSDSEVINQNITRALFDVLWDKDINIIEQPLKVSDSLVMVAQLKDKKEPPQEDFEKKKDEIRTQLEEFRQYFNMQMELSEILNRASIEKGPLLDELKKKTSAI